MTECNGCGVCCDPVQLPFAPTDFAVNADRFDPAALAFYREHLTPIPRREGRLLVGHWSSGWSEVLIPGGGPQMVPAHYYRCDLYDPDGRRCTAFDERPEMCSGYPWYGDLPNPMAQLPPTCSYRADVGQPVEPIEVEVELRARAVELGRVQPPAWRATLG